MKGAIMYPKNLPKRIHNEFKGLSIFELRAPKIRNNNEKNNKIISKVFFTINKYKKIIKKKAENTNPKFLFVGISFFIFSYT